MKEKDFKKVKNAYFFCLFIACLGAAFVSWKVDLEVIISLSAFLTATGVWVILFFHAYDFTKNKKVKK